MTHRFFEGKDHASVYQKYRVVPPDEVGNSILKYLDEKKGQPHVLAVDLGCGTGQTTRLLAPHFKKVVGIDISECQLEEARAVPGFSNIEYRKGRAEELPFSHNSVDLVTASAAAHWFDHAKFLAEASRVLKPRGCIAVLDYSTTRFHYSDSGEQLYIIYKEVHQVLLPHTSSLVVQCDSKLEDLYSAIPFPDKERTGCIQVKSSITLKNLLGFIETWSMFQTYKKEDPQAASNLLLNTQERFLEKMGVTSLDTVIEREMKFYGYLASKPE